MNSLIVVRMMFSNTCTGSANENSLTESGRLVTKRNAGRIDFCRSVKQHGNGNKCTEHATAWWLQKRRQKRLSWRRASAAVKVYVRRPVREGKKMVFGWGWKYQVIMNRKRIVKKDCVEKAFIGTLLAKTCFKLFQGFVSNVISGFFFPFALFLRAIID